MKTIRNYTIICHVNKTAKYGNSEGKKAREDMAFRPLGKTPESHHKNKKGS